MKKIKVNPKSGAYDILIGFDIIKDIGSYIKKMNLGDSIFLITSPRIGKLYLKPFLQGLKKYKYRDLKVAYVKDGEKNKSWNSYKSLLDELVSFNVNNDKRILVINLGGGVVGDIGGFVAATYNRGVDYIQVPTTLLAFVDCGIGGKTGIDFKGIKNVLGAFHQPRLVFADLELLETLPKRELKSGLVEVVKYGVITDRNMFNSIEDTYENILELNKNSLLDTVCKSYKIKADIVEKDEKDKLGIRVKLNYGHTLGHAIESASRFAYRHGEAVSIGIVCANDIALKLNLMNKNVCSRIENLLIKIGTPVKIKNCRLDNILDYFWHDKKFINGKNRLVLARDIGKIQIRENIPMEIVKEVLRKRMER